MKHTKSNWSVAHGDDHSVEVNIGGTICNVSREDKNTGEYVISREEMEANAKLIAAAPILLEACLFMVDKKGFYITEAVAEVIQNSINKATK